jgi:hypothetical protein
MKKQTLTLLVFFAVPAFAGYKMGDKRPVRTGNAPAKSAPVGHKPKHMGSAADETSVLMDLSQRFNVDEEKLQYFRSLKHGYEELVPALVVAREAQVEIGKVLKSRTDGQSWKEIADSYSIELKPLNTEVMELLEPIKKALPKKALIERPSVQKS